MFNIKTSATYRIPAPRRRQTCPDRGRAKLIGTDARVSSAAADTYLGQVSFRRFFDLMLVHLQKVLFTADEAHRASHPSEARARTHSSKPIQKRPAPLAAPRARSSSSEAQIWWLNSAHMGHKCAVWHRHHVRPTWRRSLRVGAFPKVASSQTEVRRLFPPQRSRR